MMHHQVRQIAFDYGVQITWTTPTYLPKQYLQTHSTYLNFFLVLNLL